VLRIGSVIVRSTLSTDSIIIQDTTGLIGLNRTNEFAGLNYLHELGHFVLGHGDPSVLTLQQRLECEAAAWRFAVYTYKAAGRAFGQTERAWVRDCYRTYVTAYAPEIKAIREAKAIGRRAFAIDVNGHMVDVILIPG